MALLAATGSFLTGTAQSNDMDLLPCPGLSLSEDVFLKLFPNFPIGNYGPVCPDVELLPAPRAAPERC